MTKAKKLFVAFVAVLLIFSVCLFALTACSEDEGRAIVDIEFRDESKTVKVGDRVEIKPIVTLSDGEEYSNLYGGLVWESSNENVLKLDHGGIFDALSYGDATVTCRSELNPSISASVDVRVNRDDKLMVGVKKDVYNFGYYTNYMEFEGMEIDMANRIAYELYFNEVEYVPLEASEREEALSNGLEDREAEKEAAEEEERKAAEEAESEQTPDKPDDIEKLSLVAPYADGDENDENADESGDIENKNEGSEGERKAVDCVIATYSVTAERAMQVRFSSTYYTDYVQVMVRKDFASKFESTYGLTMNGMFAYLSLDESLSDEDEERVFKVGTVNGTTAYNSFKEEATPMNRYYYDDGTSVSIEPNFRQVSEEELGHEEDYYDDYANVANDLLDGKIDGFCGDHSILNGYLSSATVFLEDAFSPQNYAVGTAIGSGFTDPINGLIDKWLTEEEEQFGGMTYIGYLLDYYGIEIFEEV